MNRTLGKNIRYQWGGKNSHTGLYRLSNGILTVVKYQWEFLCPTVPCTGAVGNWAAPGALYLAQMCRQM